MTNIEIIASYLEENEIDFKYNGDNLLTFQQWKRKGMSVKKGEKAFIQVPLWTVKMVNAKDEEGNVMKDEDGKLVKEKAFFLKTSSLFRADQVQEMKKKTKKPAKKSA